MLHLDFLDFSILETFLGSPVLWFLATVEPPVSRHSRDQKRYPLTRGVRLWEVKNVVFVCDWGHDKLLFYFKAGGPSPRSATAVPSYIHLYKHY